MYYRRSIYVWRQLTDSISGRLVGRCIYCGADRDLGDEHVVPLGLNGTLILRKASCGPCGAITSAFEGRVQNEMLGPTRHVFNMKTRHKGKRKGRSGYPVLIEDQEGRQRVQTIPVQDYPAMLCIPVFGYPGYLAERLLADGGRRVPTGFLTARVGVFQRSGARGTEELADCYGAMKMSVECEYSWVDYARLLAKIAYGMVVSQYGLPHIEKAYVLDAIMGRSEDTLRWVGCAGRERPLARVSKSHQFRLEIIQGEFRVWVSLFSDLGFYSEGGEVVNAPEHLVVVGRATETLRSYLKSRGYTGA